MIKTALLYAALIAIPLAGWLGYDYGMAKEKERSQQAAETLTDNSVAIADAGEKKKESVKVVYRDVIRTVEIASDPTNCLNTHPGNDVADSVRRIQSRASSP